MKETPAFPFKGHIEGAYGQSDGMTLRDYFAAKLMASMVESANGVVFGADNKETNFRYAKVAYVLADAMLEARES